VLTGLHMIVMLEKWELLDAVLEFPEVRLDTLDEYNNSIIHYISLTNNVGYLERILKMPSISGILVQRNFEGDEPIHTAIYNDSLECFVAVLNKYGRPETHEEFIMIKRNNRNENCLLLSILHQALRIFSYSIKIMKKVDHVDELQKTPLHYIVDSMNYEFLEVYLAKKPNLKNLNTNKESILFYCIKHHKTTFFKVAAPHQKLLSCFDEEFVMNKNREGQSLVHFACIHKNPPVLRILLEYNFSITEPDLKGKTCFDYAESNADLLKILEDNKDIK